MKIGLIGVGAIANYVREALKSRNEMLAAVLVRPSRVREAPELYVGAVADLPDDLDLVIDCAGHAALVEHGPAVLLRGFDLLSVSLGALADPDTYASLEQAAAKGGARLHLASGAIGALDCLQAARVGQMESVTYIGRKPPRAGKAPPQRTSRIWIHLSAAKLFILKAAHGRRHCVTRRTPMLLRRLLLLAKGLMQPKSV
ncbi:hypothetical protein ACFQDZ_20485 [Sulfitobacter pacificus]|uniref:hypothetical protein n=1 Tax=Sulfitobacter pacificus TaxID=1499314 RepID=UPI00360609D6